VPFHLQSSIIHLRLIISVTFGRFFVSNEWKAFRLLNGRCNHNMIINL